MKRAILLALGLALVAGTAGAQEFIHYTPPLFLNNGSGFLAPGAILLTDGTSSAPSLAFSSETNSGLYRVSASRYQFVIGGASVLSIRPAANGGIQADKFGDLNTNTFQITAGVVGVNSAGQFGWTSSTTAADAKDLILVRGGAAATLQLGANAATATAQTIKGSDSTGNAAAGGNLTLRGGAGTGTGNPVGGNLILGGGAPNGTGERGVVIIEDGGTKPTCAAGLRGAIWYDGGGVGAADTLELCAHKSDNSYAWIAMATVP